MGSKARKNGTTFIRRQESTWNFHELKKRVCVQQTSTECKFRFIIQKLLNLQRIFRSILQSSGAKQSGATSKLSQVAFSHKRNSKLFA